MTCTNKGYSTGDKQNADGQPPARVEMPRSGDSAAPHYKALVVSTARPKSGSRGGAEGAESDQHGEFLTTDFTDGHGL